MTLYDKLKDEHKHKLNNCEFLAMKENTEEILKSNERVYKLTIQQFSDVMVTLVGFENCFDALAFRDLFKK